MTRTAMVSVTRSLTDRAKGEQFRQKAVGFAIGVGCAVGASAVADVFTDSRLLMLLVTIPVVSIGMWATARQFSRGSAPTMPDEQSGNVK